MASLPTQTQVLIAGGGPVGLALAVELGGRGIDCVVIEPRETVSHARPRCKTLNVRTLEHLRRWGLVDALRARSPLPVEYSQDIVFCTSLAGYELSRFRGVLGLVTEGDRFPEPGQQAPQFVLEELLRDHVAALGTVSLALGHRVSDLDQHDDGVRVTVLNPAGEPVIVEAEYVVGADGPHSAVRGAIGADYVGEFALRPNFGMVFRAPTLEAEVRHGPAVQYWVVNESTPSLLGPLDLQGTWWMIAFGVNREQGEQSARSLIDGAAGMPVDAEVLSTDPWTARMQLVDRAREGRVFLAGDAAHLNPPFGGHGLNTGIGDAVDLGWKLAAMLDGWGGAALLDSYEAERRPVQTEVIAAAEANMRVLASELVTDAIDRKGPEGEQARALTHQNIQRTKHAEFHALNLVLDLAYDNSAIVVPRSDDAAPTAARAGALLPHGWIAPGRSVYDALGPGMSLVMLDDAPDEASHAFSAAARTREVPLTVVRVPSSVFAPKLGTAMALVRPDQHVAWIGGRPPEDPVAVIDQIRGARVGDVADRRQPIPQTDSVDNDRKT